MKYSNTHLQSIADELGELLAKKSRLAEREKTLKAQLIEAGLPVVEGDLFRVTVSHVESARSDWKTIANKLKPSRQLVTAYTKVSESNRVSVKSKLA